MSSQPILSFKAGRCEGDFDASPPKIKPDASPGYVYLYVEDELVHFCWRPRGASLQDAEIDLMMIPGDATFKPYVGANKPTSETGPVSSPVNGRVFVLKFSSSSQRYLFWLQAKARGVASHFSKRELELGDTVNTLLQATDIDYAAALGTPMRAGEEGDDDDDATMEDVQATGEQEAGSTSGAGAGSGMGQGGASSGGTSGSGGASGGRADRSRDDEATTAIQNLLKSINAGQPSGNSSGNPQQHDKPFTTLAELLPSSTTIPAIVKADPSFKEDLLARHLPSSLLFLEHQVDDFSDTQADEDVARASAQALEQSQQDSILKRVLRSPQLAQGLVSITAALRDGGLPSVADALGIEVENGGYTQRGSGIPLSGGAAVEAFLEGIKRSVEKDVTPK